MTVLLESIDVKQLCAMHLSAFLQFEHFTDCSIREYRSIKLSILKHLPIMLALCQHNTLAYYAFYYAGIFDAGLFHAMKCEKDLPSTRVFQISLYHLQKATQGSSYFGIVVVIVSLLPPHGAQFYKHLL